MHMRRLQNYINGNWVASKADAFLPVENPATGEVLAEVPLSTNDELDNAVRHAREGFKSWRKVPATPSACVTTS